MHQEPNDNWQDQGKAPGGLLWPIRRIGWFLEKYVLWPIGDSFRRFANSFRYRSPFAYIGVTLMVTLTAGAVAAAVYFYNQSENPDEAPVVADSTVPAETVIPPVPTPTTTTVTPDTTPNAGNGDDTLQGVVPSFATTAKKNGKKGNGQGQNQQLPNTVVRPAPVPKSPPLKVAHKFASTFVGYEVGEKNAKNLFRSTATKDLAKELSEDPPKLPSTGQIPRATVVNVVRGNRDKDSMDVSVSLMRTGATSELRLALVKEKGKGWLVSQVRG